MRQTQQILLFGLLLLLLTHSVSSLGVTPARTTLDFSPNLKKSVDVTVVGVDPSKKLAISVSGELAAYVIPSTSQITPVAGEESKKFGYDLSLPSDLEPGLHTADIIILEQVENTDDEIVQATLAVKTQLHIHVPFPGKYAKVGLFTSELGKGTIQFAIPVVSAGEYDLAAVRANVDIFNKLGEKIDSFNTKTISVPSGEKKDLVYEWEHEATVGDYLAVITVIYDGETRRIEKPFTIGTRVLELQEIRTDGFSLGGIAKFEMLVENKWNEQVNDVYIDTKIFDERKQILSHFKSPAEQIAALSKKVFTAYWDTAGFREGLYRTEVAINYGNESVTKDLQFEVTQNELSVIGLGYVISAGGDSSGGSGSLVLILVGVVVVLILVNLLWFILLRKRLMKK